MMHANSLPYLTSTDIVHLQTTLIWGTLRSPINLGLVSRDLTVKSQQLHVVSSWAIAWTNMSDPITLHGHTILLVSLSF